MQMGIMPTFAEKLLALRKRHGLTQKAVAEQMGLVQSQISRWEDGNGEPDIHQGLRLSKILDVPLEYLADDSVVEPTEIALSIEERALLSMGREVGVLDLFRIPHDTSDWDSDDFEGYLEDLSSKFYKHFHKIAYPIIERKHGLPAGKLTALLDESIGKEITEAVEREARKKRARQEPSEFGAPEPERKPKPKRKGAS